MRYYYSLMRYHISACNYHRIRKKIKISNDALLNNRRKLRVLENNRRNFNYENSFIKKILTNL
uniref:Uncharacterized protein n=1 Tax=viral metagenome TaxID=1070528 RepID=A0A6C0BRZ1_9ZZZZ